MSHSSQPVSNEQNHPSDSDMATSDTGKGKQPNVTRHKRKRVDENISDSISTLRNDLSELIDTRFNALSEEIKLNSVDQNKTFEFMSSKFDEMKINYEQLQKERKEDKRYIEELEDRIEMMQKNSSSTTVELRNILKKSGENKSNLVELAVKLGNELDMDIKRHEIQDIYRINTQSKSEPPILIKFTTALRKEEFIRTVKKVSRDHAHKLTTIQLKLGLSANPMYVSEHMTAKTRRLFFLAKDFSKSNGYDYCWCSRSRIFLRKKEGTSQVLVKNEAYLDELKKQQDPPVNNR